MSRVRSVIYDRLRILSSPRMRRWVKSQKWFVPVSRVLFGNEVYSDSYFADIERLEGKSVEVIAQWIVETLAPKRAIDVGCGPGHLMLSLQQRGVEMFGVDIADAAIQRCRVKGVEAQRFDLTTTDPLPGIPYDLSISCEVAEHLDEEHADRFLDHLTSAADVVYLTAAEPNPEIGPGLYHVNEQPNAYWIDKMTARGWAFDERSTSDARARFADGVIEYLARPMIFRRG